MERGRWLSLLTSDFFRKNKLNREGNIQNNNTNN
jgi:hypothetical protein